MQAKPHRACIVDEGPGTAIYERPRRIGREIKLGTRRDLLKVFMPRKRRRETTIAKQSRNRKLLGRVVFQISSRGDVRIEEVVDLTVWNRHTYAPAD
jgi:hypothetical protein